MEGSSLRESISSAIHALRTEQEDKDAEKKPQEEQAAPQGVHAPDPDGPSLVMASPADFLGPGGRFEREIKGFVPRKGQLKLAEAASKAIDGGTLLIAEAGTGTGKTYAYLIPALLSGKCTVISTASKALQDQLINKDLPRLAKFLHLGDKAKFMALKGFGNYLCIRRLVERCRDVGVPSGESGSQGILDFGDDAALPKEARQEKKLLSRLVAIKSETEREIGEGYQGCTFAEINSRFSQDVVSRFNCDRNLCQGRNCPYRDRCFAYAARRHAAGCSVVVVNHALFFADAQIESPFDLKTPCFMLPKYKAIVFDEAHVLPEAGRQHLGQEASYRALKQLCDVLVQVVRTTDGAKSFASEAEKHCKAVLESAKALSDYMRGKGDGQHDFLEYRFEDFDPGQTDPMHVYQKPCKEFRDLVAGVYQAVRNVSGFIKEIKAADDEALGSMEGQADGMLDTISGLMNLNDPDSDLRGAYAGSAYVSAHGFTLRLTPLEISKFMGKFLKGCSNAGIGVVMTSATLSVAGDFSKFRRDVGAPSEGTAELEIQSPFDYEHHAALLVSRNFPEPSDEFRDDKILDALDPVIRATDGGIFYLTTSLSALKHAAEVLMTRYGMERKVLAQNSGLSNTRLLEEFRSNGRAILVGTSSFWAGVDVQGRALSLVIIDKLPFASPSDPVTRARCNLYDSRAGKRMAHFMGISVPEAVIELRQGVGRLIRHEDDRGALVICDPRIVSRGYGSVFMHSLPPVRILGKSSELRDFMSEIRGAGDQKH
jgi:ATP-dependent DNA helicase DinG